MIFEVTTTTLQRWLVPFHAREEDRARQQLDTAIMEGLILDAKVPNTMGDKFPWRIYAAHIVAYRPFDGEIKADEPERPVPFGEPDE